MQKLVATVMARLKQRGIFRSTVHMVTPARVEVLEARRLLTADMDPTFGTNGRVIADLGTNETVHAVAVQSDGKVLLAGTAGGDAIIARLDVDGSLDATFGSAGIAKLDLGGNETFEQVVALGDGKILVGGETSSGADTRYVLARYRSDGTLDSNSGFGGTDGIEEGASGSGPITDMNISGSELFTAGGQYLRLHSLSTGSLDAGFGSGGVEDIVAAANLETFSEKGMAVAPTGKIVLLGYADTSVQETNYGGRYGHEHSCVIMLNPDGTPDDAFDDNGVRFDFGGGSAAFSADGTLIVAAASSLDAGGPVGATILERFAADGRFTHASANANEEALHLLVGADGKFYVAGQLNGLGAVRFNADGSLDTSYSKDGVAYDDLLDFTRSGQGLNFSAASAIDSDGRVIIASQFTNFQQTFTGPAIIVRLSANPAGGGITPLLQPGGTLALTGTQVADQVNILLNSDAGGGIVVQANGERFTYADGVVNRITFAGGGGNDVFSTSDDVPAIAVSLDGGDGNDVLLGGKGNDTLIGGAGNDQVDGGLGTDQLSGGDGIDTLSYHDNINGVRLTPGDGVDNDGRSGENDHIAPDFEVFVGTAASDYIEGTAGDDTILGGGGFGDDTMLGLDGNDSIVGGLRDDWIEGGDGNDTLEGSSDGGPGSDSLFGGNGNDLLEQASYEDGGAGDDILLGRSQPDVMIGGDGNDLLRGYGGKDRMVGGAGKDRLYGYGGNDQIFGDADADRLYGGSGSNYLDGGSSADRFYTESGSDTLLGQGGNDIFFLTHVPDQIGGYHVFGGSGTDTASGADASGLLASIETRRT